MDGPAACLTPPTCPPAMQEFRLWAEQYPAHPHGDPSTTFWGPLPPPQPAEEAPGGAGAGAGATGCAGGGEVSPEPGEVDRPSRCR